MQLLKSGIGNDLKWHEKSYSRPNNGKEKSLKKAIYRLEAASHFFIVSSSAEM